MNVLLSIYNYQIDLAEQPITFTLAKEDDIEQKPVGLLFFYYWYFITVDSM